MATTTLETLISDTGGCGRFQVLQITAINSLRVFVIWGVMFMTFGNYDPGWKCKIANVTSIEMSFTSGNISTLGSLPADMPPTFPNFTTCFDASTKRDVISNGNMTRAFNEFLLHGDCDCHSSCRNIDFNNHAKTVVSEWGLVCGEKWIASLIISLQMVGYFFGCASAGQISERFGRRLTLYVSGALYCVANLAAAFSVSWPMYACLLFLTGLGAGGVLTVALVFSFEFLQPQWRGIIGGLPLLNIAGTVFSLVVFLERDWHLVHITMAVTCGLCLLPFFWTQESMRWLAVQGRIDEAEAVVAKMAATNGRQMPDKESMEVLYKMADDQEAVAVAKYNYLDLFKEKNLRAMVIKVSLCWTFMTSVYFALAFSVKVFSGNFYLNFFVYSILDIPIVVLIGPLVNRWGRKLIGTGIISLSFLICVALVIISLIASGKDSHATVIFVLTAAVKSLLAGSKCVLSIVTAELPPTAVRTLFYAFCMLLSRLGPIVAPYLIPEGDNISIKLSVMAALLLLTGLMFLSLPETMNRSMKDMVNNLEKTQHDIVESTCEEIECDVRNRNDKPVEVNNTYL